MCGSSDKPFKVSGHRYVCLPAVLWLSLLLAADISDAETFYVDVDGIGGPSSDSNPGTIEQPFKTIEKARDTIRSFGTDGHTVYIRGGTYRITSALQFTSDDSGVEGAPNVYRNYPGETPVISGGQVLDVIWEPYTHLGHSIYKTNVGSTFFRSMWVDDAEAQRARTPNGAASMADYEYFTSQATPDATQAIGYSEGDIDPTWTNLTEVEIQFVREFTSRRQRIASVDDVNDVVWMSGNAYSGGFVQYYSGNRYWVENVFEGLDSPGEWYLNTTTHDLYYYPIGGKNPNTSTIIVGNLGTTSTAGRGVLLDNNGADYLEFRNLTFAHTDWYIPFGTTGWDGYYIEFVWTGPMVYLRGGVDGSRFDGCTFKFCGGHGLYLYQGSHNTISHCTFTDIGGVPIRLGNESTLDGTTTSNNAVSDNTISRYGADLPSIGMGIVVGVTTNCCVSHNQINDGSFMGIQLGRNTSDAMACGNNVLEYNHISNVQLIHPDSGALYSTGQQTDSVYRYNVVHGLSQGPAIYPDDSTSGITFENNLIYDCYWGVLSRGTSAAVRNNIFASFKDPAYTFVYFVTVGTNVTNNIFYHTPLSAYALHWNLAGNRLLDQNLYYNAAGAGVVFTSYNWTWAVAAQDILHWDLEVGGVFDQDPLFVDPANHNYRLQSNSPALLPVGSGGIGFVDFSAEISDVGPRARSFTILALAGTGGSVSPSGEASVTEGGSLTVTFTPDAGYSVADVLVDGVSVGAVSSYTFENVTAEHAIRVVFGQGGYTLDVSASGGSVSQSPDKASYEDGEVVILQAAADTGYTFGSWSGDASGTSTSVTVTMDGNKSVTANFVADVAMYSLSVAASGGTVSRSPDQANYASGTEVTLVATANTGYTFTGWSGAASGTSSSVTVTMDADKSVIANFAANAYTLAIASANGSVAIVPQKTTYSYGDTVSVQAVASTGYHFTGWSGDLSGSSNPASLVMNGNKSVTAGFSINTYTLNATAVNGSVTRSPDQTLYNYGETVNLQAVAADGYEFTGWSGALSGTANPIALVMSSDKSVTATFEAVTVDKEAPMLLNASPAADAIQTPLNSLVSLHIADVGEGVDANTVNIAVNGASVYSGNVASYTSGSGVCRRVGTKADYTYAYQAAGDFDYDATVTVTVSAADLEGNAMTPQSYSFRTQMRAFGPNRCASWGPDGVDKGSPAMASDASGNHWVVYHAGVDGARDIYVSRLADGNEQFGSPVQVTKDVLDECNPDIAIGTDGRFTLVWQDNRRGNWDIYASTSDDGITWSSPVAVTDSNDNEIQPAIAVDSQSPNRAYVTWEDSRSGNQDVWVAVSSDGFVSKTAKAVTSNALDQTDPRIAVDASNVAYIVWTDFRNGTADVYGAASNSGPWSNVAVATGAGNQSAPVIAAEPTGSTLHFAWVTDGTGDNDVCYAASNGLPTSPLVGVDIIDDSSGANQEAPAIAVAEGADVVRIFVCWQDARNVGVESDTDIYAVEVRDGDETNLLVGDGGTSTNQSEPAMAIDAGGRPSIVWTDDRNATKYVYFAATTSVASEPLDEKLISSTVGGTVGAASPAGEDDVSVMIPAGACPYDVTVSVAKIQDLQPGSSVDLLPYEFGPSGLQFDAAVTITMPYLIADYGSNPPQPYWYDTLTGALTQQGITNIEYLALSTTVGALRFQTTHFTPYTLVGVASDGGSDEVPSESSSSGGGCSLAPGLIKKVPKTMPSTSSKGKLRSQWNPTPTGTPSGRLDVRPALAGIGLNPRAVEYFVPYAVLAAIMVGLRRRDVRRYRR